MIKNIDDWQGNNKPHREKSVFVKKQHHIFKKDRIWKVVCCCLRIGCRWWKWCRRLPSHGFSIWRPFRGSNPVSDGRLTLASPQYSPPTKNHKKQCSNNVKIRYKCIKHIGLLIKIRVLDEQSCPRKIYSYNFNALGQIY